METKTFKTLEFDKVLTMLASFAKNDKAKDIALSLAPSKAPSAVEQMLAETDSAVTLILKYGSPEIVRIDEISEAS